MRQLRLFYIKENKEFWRSYKWIWLPLVFIALGIMQPITTYYQPQILELAGLSEEAINQLPEPSATQVLAKTLSQYSLLGVLILVLAGMSLVSGERAQRTVTLLFVRPVSIFTFILSKWLALSVLALVSFWIGFTLTWTDTVQLIGEISFVGVWKAALVYSVWLLFIVGLSVFSSACFKSGAPAAFFTLAVASVLSILTTTFSDVMACSPAALTQEANHFLTQSVGVGHLWVSLISTCLIILALLVSAFLVFRKHDFNKNE